MAIELETMIQQGWKSATRERGRPSAGQALAPAPLADTGFHPLTEPVESIKDVALQVDGKALIVGAFTHVYGQPRRGMRLIGSGSVHDRARRW